MLIDADYPAAKICGASLSDLQAMGLDPSDISIVSATVGNLVELHDQGWNNIWWPITAKARCCWRDPTLVPHLRQPAMIKIRQPAEICSQSKSTAGALVSLAPTNG